MPFDPAPNAIELIGPVDILLFVAILGLTVLAIVWGHLKHASIQRKGGPSQLLEYMVMGRTLTLPLFTATLVATWYGGIFGVTEIAFQFGVYNFLTQGVFWYVTYLAFAFFIVPRLSVYDAITLPDLVGKMFGPKAAKVSAVFNFFNVVPVAYALSLGLFGQALFGGPLWLSMAIGTALVSVYALFGGLRAVVFSDLIQFVVMCGAVLMVAIISIQTFGGLEFLKNALPDSHFAPLGGNSMATTLVWGFIALSTLVDPNFYQRCFAAESPKTAKKGIVIATLIWVVFDLCTTLGAMYARALIPEALPSQAYLLYALQLLPDGLRGIFLAGVAATILSTLDSYIFVASNTISYDLMPASMRDKRWVRRLGVVSVGILSICLALIFDGSIRDVWKTLGSYSAGCLLGPVVFGYFKPGVLADKTFVIATVGAAFAMTFWRFLEPGGVWAQVDGLYVGVATTLILGFASHKLGNNSLGSA